MTRRLSLACLALLALGTGCGGSKSGSGDDVCKGLPAAPPARTTKAPWSAPANPMSLTCKAGLVPENAEFLEYHVHAHLDVFVDGKPILVPAGIGIDSENPAVQADTGAGGRIVAIGLARECDTPCISPLHTHDLSGLLHTETKTPQPNHLGQFFDEWAVRLTPECVGGYCSPKTPVAIYVDGKNALGDPRAIELSDGREIAIVIGTPPDTIPSEFPK